MINSASRTTWDIVLFGIPLLALLIFGVFRLDEVFASRKEHPAVPAKPVPSIESRHKMMHSDPDGRPWDDK